MLADDLDLILKSICDVTTGKEPCRSRVHAIDPNHTTDHFLSELSITLLLRYDFTYNYYTIPNTSGLVIAKVNVIMNAAIYNFELQDNLINCNLIYKFQLY